MHILTILMDYLGLTQVELAKKAGITPADLNEMINKEPYGLITKYQRLAQYLGISVDCIVNNDILGISESFFDLHSPGSYQGVIQNRHSIFGREAEEEAFFMERERVASFSPVLSRLVLPYFKLRASSPGYDILSYSPDGSPVYIEVKNAAKSNPTNFRLTSHEYEVACSTLESGLPYLIYLFSGWRTDDQRLEIKPFSTLTSENRIAPKSYLCDLREIHTFVNGITYYRMMHNLSQIDLATTLEIPPASLCKYESGEHVCPVSVYQRLGTFFHIKIDELLKTYPNPSIS